MIKCIAIDDEPLALMQLVNYIEKTPFLECLSGFDNAFSAIDFLQSNKVDLMFVDINMPDLTGIDFVKSLENPPRVIFTTAYSEYAIDGFKVDAIDYLLKPISYIDFMKAANKASVWFTKVDVEPPKIKADEEFLLIKSEHKIVRINYTDIKYIEGMREYVRFHLTNQKPIMTLLSMKKVDESLPKNLFMRVHRSYIVNLKQITTIERLRIIFDDKVYIPVGEQYKDNFQEYLNKNFLI
jgi:two-component system LytT family response regulator